MPQEQRKKRPQEKGLLVAVNISEVQNRAAGILAKAMIRRVTRVI